MKKETKIIIFGLIVGFIIVVGIFVTVFSTTEHTDESDYSEYHLCMNRPYDDEVDTYWECTEMNHSLFAQLDNESYYPVFKNIVSLEKRTTIELCFCISDEYPDSWDLEGEQWINASEDSVSLSFKILKWPSRFVDAWIGKWADFTPIIIPCDSIDYLSNAKDNFPEYYSEIVKVDDFKIYEDYRVIGNHSKNVLEYNEDGILQCYTLYYDDQTVFEIILTDYNINIGDSTCTLPSYYSCFLIIPIALMIFVFIIPFAIIIYTSKKKHMISNSAPKQKDSKIDKRLPQNKPSNLFYGMFIGLILLFLVSFIFILLFPIALFLLVIWILILISSGNSTTSGKNSPSNRIEKQKMLKNMTKVSALCSTCGGELADQAIFCHRCGKSIYTKFRYCSYCSSSLMEDAAFCHMCGNLTQGAFDLPVPIKTSGLNTTRINSTNKSNKLCTACGSEMKWDHFYCQNCGNKF